VLAQIPSAAISGNVKVTVAANGVFTGRIIVGGTGYGFAGTFDQSGVGRFGPTKAARLGIDRTAGRRALVLALQWNASSGSGVITGTISDPGVFVASIFAERALFTAAKNPAAPQLNVPASWLGTYNIVLASSPSTLVPAPRGFGWGRVTVQSSGSIRFTGVLADGTAMTGASTLCPDGSWPLYVAPDSGRSAVTGMVSLPGDGDSDANGNIWWFKDAQAERAAYPAGWPQGIAIDLFGSRYVASKTLAGAFDGSATAASIASPINTAVSFSGGALPKDFIARASVRGDSLQVVSTELKELKLAMVKKTGVLSGSFLHPSGGKRTPFKGVYLQRQGIAAGFFIGSAQSGEVLLTRD
jgi:hypothetical protein